MSEQATIHRSLHLSPEMQDAVEKYQEDNGGSWNRALLELAAQGLALNGIQPPKVVVPERGGWRGGPKAKRLAAAAKHE